MGPCERCKKAQATCHLTNIEPDGKKVERHLCERCAAEEGWLQVPKSAADNITQLLETFVAAGKAGAAKLAGAVCENCGMSYIEFRNQGMLGCANDYEVFREPLLGLLKRAHDGADRHAGKAPRSRTSARRVTQQDLRRLRRQLEEALAAEDYERAAKLRDRMRELEAG